MTDATFRIQARARSVLPDFTKKLTPTRGSFREEVAEFGQLTSGKPPMRRLATPKHLILTVEEKTKTIQCTIVQL